MSTNFEDCISKGLLRRIPKSKQNAEESIKTSEKWLTEADANHTAGSYNSCLLSSYLAMFHAARAILWHDGYREKSHYCVARYLEAVYIKKRFLETEWVDLLDYYRDLRHDDSYSTSFTATEEDCKGAVKTSKKFVKRMKELLSSIKN